MHSLIAWFCIALSAWHVGRVSRIMSSMWFKNAMRRISEQPHQRRARSTHHEGNLSRFSLIAQSLYPTCYHNGHTITVLSGATDVQTTRFRQLQKMTRPTKPSPASKVKVTPLRATAAAFAALKDEWLNIVKPSDTAPIR